MPGRPPVLFVAWTSRPGRAIELVAALDGEAYAVYPALPGGRRFPVPLRYGVSGVLTLARLVRRRPQAVIVTNPPIVAPVVVALYCAVTKTPFILDSHPTAFGAKGHKVSQRLMPVHRRLARRAVAVLVTTQQWVDLVAAWGGTGIVVHEAPPDRSPAPARAIEGRPSVLFVGIFGGDEPVDAVVEAARTLPDIDFAITGDLRRCPPRLLDGAPPNVRFTGYLHGHAYSAAIDDADVVLALTSEPTSVMRAAYEAVYAERPLVASDSAALRPLFPSAVFVDNDPRSIAAGICRAIDDHEALVAAAPGARELQLGRWEEQLNSLRRYLHP